MILLKRTLKSSLLFLPVSLKAGDPAMFLAAQQHEERNEVKGDPAKVKWIRKEAGNTGGDSHQSRMGQKDEKNRREKMTGNMMENTKWYDYNQYIETVPGQFFLLCVSMQKLLFLTPRIGVLQNRYVFRGKASLPSTWCTVCMYSMHLLFHPCSNIITNHNESTTRGWKKSKHLAHHGTPNTSTRVPRNNEARRVWGWDDEGEDAHPSCDFQPLASRCSCFCLISVGARTSIFTRLQHQNYSRCCCRCARLLWFNDVLQADYQSDSPLS